MRLKENLKSILPLPIFRFISYVNVYRKRIWVWMCILHQIKGENFKDEVKLVFSFFSGIFLSFKNLNIWQDPHLLWDATLLVPEAGKFLVRKKTDDLFHILPDREGEVFTEIKNNLLAGDQFIDAGANIGFYSILAANQVGHAGKVVAIEMLSVNAKRLINNVEINDLKNVKVIEKALSDKNGDKITISIPSEKFGQASIVETKADSDNRIAVETIRLDTLIDANAHIKLLKIDTEGAEKLVLNGAERILDNIQNIIFEMYDNDQNKEFVFDLLQSQGFKFKRLGGKDYLALRQ